MNRLPVLFTAALLAAVTATQTEAQVGVKGGVSHGNISNSGLLPGDLNARTGFAIGLSFATMPTDPVGIGVEALYAQRGANSPEVGSGYELDYIDVPLYLRLMIPAEGMQPFVYAGPQVSFEVRCRTGAGDCPDGDRPSTTYAGVIGAGLRFGAEGGFSVEGRYVYGLRDLNLGTVTDDESYRDRSFEILFGINFFDRSPEVGR